MKSAPSHLYYNRVQFGRLHLTIFLSGISLACVWRVIVVFLCIKPAMSDSSISNRGFCVEKNEKWRGNVDKSVSTEMLSTTTKKVHCLPKKKVMENTAVLVVGNLWNKYQKGKILAENHSIFFLSFHYLSRKKHFAFRPFRGNFLPISPFLIFNFDGNDSARRIGLYVIYMHCCIFSMRGPSLHELLEQSRCNRNPWLILTGFQDKLIA